MDVEVERPARRRSRGLLACAALAAIAGIAARLVLAGVSTGTNDVLTWEKFARAIRETGLASTYRAFPDFNHPPLMGLMAALVSEITERTGLRFAFWFRVPGIVAELGMTWLVWSVWRRRASASRAATAAALFAWNPCTLVVSGYHGNTDCIYPFFVLLAAAMLDREAKRPFAAGLALGAALNVKLMPIVVLPAFALARQSGRELLRLGAGLAIALSPFAYALITATDAFVGSVLGYAPPFDRWGVCWVCHEMIGYEIAPALALEFGLAFVHHGRYVVLAAALGVALLARARRMSRGESNALALALMLVLAPGFGIQYVAAPCAALFAVDLAAALVYSWLAGAFAIALYASWIVSTKPYLYSVYSGTSDLIAWLGIPAWLALIGAVVRGVMRARVKRAG